jgi:hypothetical protein
LRCNAHSKFKIISAYILGVREKGWPFSLRVGVENPLYTKLSYGKWTIQTNHRLHNSHMYVY